MDATLYFELVDAIARIDKQSDLAKMHERVSATLLNPLERRVVERALRAKCEALALRREFAMAAGQELGPTAKPIAARG
jgi:hypothetical protein